MSAIVSITTMTKIINIVARVKKHDVTVVPYIWGSHGIGKTSIVRQIAETLGYNCEVLNLANQTPEDLLGYPDGKGGFIMPKWLSRNEGKPTIYFLDEINRAPKYVLQSMFNFINEGRIHTHFIGKDDIVIAAGNPPDQRYDTVEFDDVAFLSRFAHFYLEPTIPEYLNFLEKDGVHKALLTAIKTNPDSFSNTTKPEFMVQVTPDRRSAHRCGIILNHMEPSEIEEVASYLFTAMVGPDFTNIIIRNWKELISKVLTGAEILNTVGIKFDFAKRDMDTVVILNSNVADYIKTDLFNEKTKKYKLTDVQKINFCNYFEYITSEAKVALFAEMKRKMSLAIVDFMEITIGLDKFNEFMEMNTTSNKK